MRALPTGRAVVLALSAAACLGAPAPAVAQQTDSLSHSFPEYLERAYLFKNFPGNKTGEWYEALLPVHIPLRQNLQGAYDRVLTRDTIEARHSLAAYFSMAVNLRQTRESSAPVRTPSYMPKLTVTYFNVKRRDGRALGKGPSPTSVRLWSVPVVPFGHYSNGQDGCLYTFQRRVGADCADSADGAHLRAPGPEDVNRVDGSFSSHYVQVGVFYRRIALDPSAAPDAYAIGRSYWSLGAQVRDYHLYSGVRGGMSRELRDVYGPTRVRALWNHVAQRGQHRVFGPGQLRWEVMAEWLPGASDRVDPVRGYVELARTMDKRSGWGVFGRVYNGQDDYNLGFLTSIRVLQVGVTTSGERMPAFKL